MFHPRTDEQPGMLRLPGTILQGILAGAALVFLRVYLGVAFLLAAIPKLEADPIEALRSLLTGVTLTSGYGFYQRFASDVLLPNVEVFGPLVFWSELLVGFALVVGLVTRLSACLGLILLVNFMLAEGAWFGQPSSHDAALAAIAVGLIIGAAGRAAGLDAFLARRWPRSPLW